MTIVENPHAGQGAVLLDIGGEVGAVIVSAPAGLAGAEIEICPAGQRSGRPDEGVGWWSGDWRRHDHGPGDGHHHGPGDGHDHGPGDGPGHDRADAHAHVNGPAWPHVAVLRRPTPTGCRYAAVFPGLRAGRYELWLRPGRPSALVVSVSGGAVTETAWPDGQGW